MSIIVKYITQLKPSKIMEKITKYYLLCLPIMLFTIEYHVVMTRCDPEVARSPNLFPSGFYLRGF